MSNRVNINLVLDREEETRFCLADLWVDTISSSKWLDGSSLHRISQFGLVSGAHDSDDLFALYWVES